MMHVHKAHNKDLLAKINIVNMLMLTQIKGLSQSGQLSYTLIKLM